MHSGVLGDSCGIERAAAGGADTVVFGPSAERRIRLLEFVSDSDDLLFLGTDNRVTLCQLHQQL